MGKSALTRRRLRCRRPWLCRRPSPLPLLTPSGPCCNPAFPPTSPAASGLTSALHPPGLGPAARSCLPQPPSRGPQPPPTPPHGPGAMSELEQLRQEAEQLRNQIRVRAWCGMGLVRYGPGGVYTSRCPGPGWVRVLVGEGGRGREGSLVAQNLILSTPVFSPSPTRSTFSCISLALPFPIGCPKSMWGLNTDPGEGTRWSGGDWGWRGKDRRLLLTAVLLPGPPRAHSVSTSRSQLGWTQWGESR